MKVRDAPAQAAVPQKADPDAAFVAQALGMRPAPFVDLPPSWESRPGWKSLPSAQAAIQEQDLLLVEGPAEPAAVEALGAQALAVSRLRGEATLTSIFALQRSLAGRLAGVVLNAVPAPSWELAQERLRPALEREGVRVFGILPQERLLLAPKVQDLAEALNGEFVCGADGADALVESLAIGASHMEDALTAFRRRPRAAVVTRGSRPDLCLAAMEAGCACLILAEGAGPVGPVAVVARQRRIPVIVAPHKVLSAIAALEGLFGDAPFHHPQKAERFSELLRQHCDLSALCAALGLSAGPGVA